jgi:hypothetical protein
MKTWSDLIDFIAPAAPDVPDSYIEQALKWSAIRLCERSGLFKEELFLDSQASVGDYPLEAALNDCWRPHVIYTLCVNGSDYAPQASDLCCNQSCHRVYFLHDPLVVNIRPVPIKDEVDGIRIVMSVKPHVDSCNIPDMLYDDWSDVLTAGTLAKLMKSARQPWSNLTLAREFEKEFNAGVNRAMIRSYKGFTNGPIRLKARPFVPADRRGTVLSGANR